MDVEDERRSMGIARLPRRLDSVLILLSASDGLTRLNAEQEHKHKHASYRSDD